ncbi:MAG: class II fructose-bisphosphate aldolase [Verrucomicrobiaceae bacterium]
MTIATMRQLLDAAEVGRYAVAGLVVLGWEDAVAFVEAADETGLPIILQAGPGCRRYTPIPVLARMFRHLADQARVPIACHIDHATTLEECLEGIEHGFTSVMIDGSSLPLADNIALTQRVVSAACPAGVSVEGEVGFVGYAEGRGSRFTAPEEASRFTAETGIDALAISVGNLHLQQEKTDGVNFAALGAVEAATTVPLVMHGASGIPPTTRKLLAHQHRVRKFNIGTELRQAFGTALRKSLADQPSSFDRIELLKPTIAALRAAARDAITGIGPATLS